MFKRKQIDAVPGDLFVKAGDTKNNVWIVERLFEHVDGILHARLQLRAFPRTTITVSATALADPVFFERRQPMQRALPN
jgi:hypothetical protein